MYTGKLVFSQVMDFMPMHTFRRCVTRYQGDYKVKKFTCLDQYLCMAFAQITYRESLRDIEICLRAQEQKLYHIDIRGKVSLSTLADANEQRNWNIYANLAYSLINTARKLYSDESFAFELEQTAYALDSTTIDLCLFMFPWANFRRNKGAIKLHTLLDLRCSIPTFIHISDGKLPDYDREEQIGWEEIGRILDGKPSPEPGLLEKSEEPPVWAKVNLNRVSVERLRHFGDIYLALLLWSRLGFAAFCKERLPAGREEIPWALMVCILVIARFCAPSSELQIADSWYGKTAPDDLLGVPFDKINEDRLYRALDALLPHKG